MRSPGQNHAAEMRDANRARARGRLLDYLELRQLGETREAAAQRTGVSERTAWRYEARIREMPGPCRICRGPHHAKGLCSAHYWQQARPARGGDRTAPAHAAITAYALARAEDYLDLRQMGETREAAAQRLGVTLRTTYRIEARLRSGAGRQQRKAA